MIALELTGDDPGARLEQAVDRVADNLTSAVHTTGAGLQTLIRAKASTGYHGPSEPRVPGTGPGPNVVTGDYRRSIALNATREGDVSTAVVSSNAPQAARLEYGFNDVDSLGRQFRQPPYPHWRPAVEETRPRFQEAARAAVEEAFR